MESEIEGRIKALRKKIETVDGQILHLLNERAGVALEVGRAKSEGNIDLYDPQREEAILQRLKLENSGPFPQRAISSVFREIISACRSLETELTVAYLGPAATFTHMACIQRFGSSVRALPQESIREVFEAAERGAAHYGVVPIENSTEGAVNQTLDLFIEYDVKICGEILVRITHDLLSQTGKPGDVREIYSHPQAFGQCRGWLMKNLPRIPQMTAASTAKAAEIAGRDGKAAAIASSFAANLYGLKVIESGIEDYRHNYTRFLILGKQNPQRTGTDKTSVLFSIPHTPGTLCQVLAIFSEKGINLTKIESRPMKGKPWEYVFYVDFEGHAADAHVNEAITEVKKTVLFMEILGSYPVSSGQCAGERE